MNEKILLAVLIIVFIILVLLMFLVMRLSINKNRREMHETSKKMNESLIMFQSSLLNTMHNDLHTLNESTLTHISGLEKSVNEQMVQNLRYTSDAYASVLKEVGKIDETQQHLKELSSDIHSLHAIFNDKKTRGIYGEVELYTLLERTFGDNPSFFAKQYRLSNGCIADAVIFGNDALGKIVVDSKFPLENYNRLQDTTLNVAHKKVLLNEFKHNVKKHIQDIADKYIIPNETCDFAYMFIPAEAVFSYINAYLPEILHFSYEKKVYLASPSTLMSYISAVKALYLGQKKNEKMQEIQQELTQLSVEFHRFSKRYETLMKDMDKISADMKDVIVTAQKITRKFEKIEQVELDFNEKGE